MSGPHWSKFFWSDWEADEGLRQCSLAAQGLWMRMLCICAKGDPYGYLVIRGESLDVEGVAKAASAPAAEVDNLIIELERWGVFSRDRKGRIYSRRMLRDKKRSQEGRKWKEQGLQGTPTHPSPPSRVSKGGGTPQKLEATSEKESKKKKDISVNEFENWWLFVPRKVDKGGARKAYKAALKITDYETLNAGIIRYAQEVAGKDDEFIAHPATWLNGERWLDETLRKSHGNRNRSNGKHKPSPHDTLLAAGAFAATSRPDKRTGKNLGTGTREPDDAGESSTSVSHIPRTRGEE